MILLDMIQRKEVAIVWLIFNVIEKIYPKR